MEEHGRGDEKREKKIGVGGGEMKCLNLKFF
jgi:hypothetical protein